jgi:hypothetical protein
VTFLKALEGEELEAMAESILENEFFCDFHASLHENILFSVLPCFKLP